MELIGIVVVIAGITCLFSDPSAERVDGKTGSAWVYFVCISCAFFASFYFILNGVVVKALPIFFALTVQAILGFFINGALNAFIYSGDYVFFSTDASWGAFGLV